MIFDWLKFLTNFSIEYETAGRNTSRGNVSIKCPFCKDDPSYHLGISLKGYGWSCWRNPDHKGGKPHRLIQQLLNCTYAEAVSIVGNEIQITVTSSFLDQITNLLGTPAMPEDKPTSLSLLPNFKPITSRPSGLARYFNSYLYQRGYGPSDIDRLAEEYQLKYAVDGPFGYRIIFPVYQLLLVTWTGRAITARAAVRYKTLSTDPEKSKSQGLPRALLPITDTLFNYPNLMDGGEKLYLCEGPFDSMKMDYLGKQFGIRATCLFGKKLYENQFELLAEISDKFKQKYLLLDKEVELGTLSILDKLQPLGFKRAVLPEGVDDPAELSLEEIKSI